MNRTFRSRLAMTGKKNCEHQLRVIASPLFLAALRDDNRRKRFTQSRYHPQSARGYLSRDT